VADLERLAEVYQSVLGRVLPDRQPG